MQTGFVCGGSDSSDSKSRSFFMAAGITVTIGIALAVMAIVFLRPRVKQVAAPSKIITAPAPPPKIIIKEVVKEIVKEVFVPTQEPPPQVRERKAWEGIWRPKRSELPMFKVNELNGMAAGIFATTAGSVLPFQGGKVVGDAIELIVDDSLFRLHFRLSMLGVSSMNVETWITDEDWLISLSRGNQMVGRGGQNAIRTPQEALLVRMQLAVNAKLTRKPETVGIFYRGTEN